MKTKSVDLTLLGILLNPFVTTAVQAQGTLTFNQPWVSPNHAHYLWWYNDPGGWVISVFPQQADNYLVRLLSLDGYPSNGSPFLCHIRFEGIASLTVLGPTNSGVFGLTSVDLADPVAPSSAPIEIVFNGFKGDGSMVSQTFIVGGGGSSSFQTCYFGPDFAYGLVRVEIPSPAWAMDNLVWVPEPGTYGLLGLGTALLACWRFRRKIWGRSCGR